MSNIRENAKWKVVKDKGDKDLYSFSTLIDPQLICMSTWPIP